LRFASQDPGSRALDRDDQVVTTSAAVNEHHLGIYEPYVTDVERCHMLERARAPTESASRARP
jgi:hypothetical protein